MFCHNLVRLSLLSAALITKAFATNYYVDGSKPTNGDGLSWATAWNNLSSATSASLLPGDVVWIKEGTYTQRLILTKSGSQTVPVTPGISLQQGNRAYFPIGTDLSSINLAANPGQYYLHVYRSRYANNGFFKIVAVNIAQRWVEVEGMPFVNELGIAGNPHHLSACVSRPIFFRNAASNPAVDRVVLDLSTTTFARACYIGQYLAPLDANPVNFVVVENIDITKTKTGGGIAIQCSNFNVIKNCRIYNTATDGSPANGIFINGNADRPANYNLILNNELYNTPYEGIYIGSGGSPAYNNHAHFNHLIANNIYTSGMASNAILENAIDIKDGNRATVVSGNFIHDFRLITHYNGALDVRTGAHHTLVYNNIFRDVTIPPAATSYYPVVLLYGEADSVHVFNNLIYNTVVQHGNHFAFDIRGTNTTGVMIAHNTVYQTHQGLLMSGGSNNGTVIVNNIIAPTSTPRTNWYSQNFTFTHNTYNSTPAGYPSEPARIVGSTAFSNPAVGDFSLLPVDSTARNQATATGLPHAVPLDFYLLSRVDAPDRGAFENQIPLPVTLAYFKGSCEASGVVLQWFTLTEQDAAYFEVQTSMDGRTWHPVANLPAAGTTTKPTAYTWKHETPWRYYRLMQWDVDGVGHAVGQVIAPGCPPTAKILSRIIGNPLRVGEPLRIEIRYPEAWQISTQVYLCSTDGRVLKNWSVSSSVQERREIAILPISEDVPPGVYVLSISAQGLLVAAHPVVIVGE